MAVQKSRRTRSTRGMRRSHDSLRASTTAINTVTGETHLRHHLTADGYHHRGRQVVAAPVVAEEDEQE